MNNYYHIITAPVLLLVLFIAIGCATTEDTATGDDSPPAEADTAAVGTDDTDLNRMLENNRTKLSDLHVSQQHDMPEAFLQKKTDNESTNNPERGYRVQILSTRNDKELADSVSREFRTWADSTIQGYTAQSYVSYNQPHYRVHVGDFQERSQANSFSKLIKNEFPDAWVVHDRIEPSNTPADTASFSFITEEDKLKEMNPDSLNQNNP